MLTCSISNLELLPWTAHVGPTINPVPPTAYTAINLPDSLALYCIGPAYGGWLANCAQPLLAPFQNIVWHYSVTIDKATLQCAQVIETDFKITDSAGWTYDGSGQWNIAEGWMFQINNPWVDTGIKLQTPPTPGVPMDVWIRATLDYGKHTITMQSVTAQGAKTAIPAAVATIPAKQMGWGINTILPQLQQCTNGKPGAYSLEFKNVGFDLS